MISPSLESLRLFLHLLGVTVWVGGQITLGALVSTVRTDAPAVLGRLARAFARLAWPALGLVALTGVWSLASIDPAERGSAWLVTLGLKLLVVGLAAAATFAHSRATSARVRGIGAGVALVASLVAMYLGLLLALGSR